MMLRFFIGLRLAFQLDPKFSNSFYLYCMAASFL
jgi:hypothetical protein